ncbi:Deoxyhypusine synthase [Piedraia hortae CBS 480.64]|uniref:deoxyhypusine synthase n=1 Tax=Piedraia hortae CBS 480.64 TaxID=1314780 RepID=A0A6A7BU26_9PEZI|nr:Deoxyhypusine synthase [Piedraia hortae CBS 480.64]
MDAPGHEAVFQKSETLPKDAIAVQGLDFDRNPANDIKLPDFATHLSRTGYQASALGRAVEIVKEMQNWKDVETGTGTTIFLGYTSNLVSSGLRETIRWLVQHRYVSAIVTTAGGVEEDLIKCLAPTFLGGGFDQAPGESLRRRGINRIGDLLVPNDNYCAFEDWLMPILDRVVAEQEENKVHWTPSKLISRLGKEINNKDSICYWAWKNDIPIFSPALTDGSLGDMLYFHTFKCDVDRHIRIDIVEDIRKINTIAVRAKRTGMIVCGGGLVKHHIANANLMRNGADSAVYINTAQEFDGSDAGARPDEAVSWGKIKPDGSKVKVCADATIILPILVAATFAKE